MSIPPLPVVFEPIFKPKPWGGRRLATLLNKALPPDELIGEAWELADLPGNESRVRHGPLAGKTLGELVQMWGADLLGGTELIDGRFPLLIKFLDARENLSVQVHPKPADDDPAGWQPGVKHEAWYVIHADPGAKLYIGLKPGVGPEDLARVANTPAIVDVLRAWDAQPGQCCYLPSGTVHTLGAGVMVAEIQTPFDVTYRLYDWGRVDAAGRPRKLHVEQALANIRYDITDDVVVQKQTRHATELHPVVRLAACERFRVDFVRLLPGRANEIPAGRARIWIILAGAGHVSRERYDPRHNCCFHPGEVILIPAGSQAIGFELTDDTEFLEVTIPTWRR